MYRDYVLIHLDRLMKKIYIMKNHYKLSAPLQLSPLKMHQTKLAQFDPYLLLRLDLLRNQILCFRSFQRKVESPISHFFNLAFPTNGTYPKGTILSTPEHGIFFWNTNSFLCFCASKIPIADSQLLRAIFGIIKSRESTLYFGVRCTKENKCSCSRRCSRCHVHG